MNTTKALLGVVTGIVAGAVIGVLFAPEKGSNTRKVLLKKGEDLAEDINEKIDKRFEELMHSITGKVTKIKNDVLPSKKAEVADN